MPANQLQRHTGAPLADYAPPSQVIDVRWQQPEREAEPEAETVTHEYVVVYESRATWHIIAAAWVTCGVACAVLVGIYLAYLAGMG